MISMFEATGQEVFDFFSHLVTFGANIFHLPFLSMIFSFYFPSCCSSRKISPPFIYNTCLYYMKKLYICKLTAYPNIYL